MDVISALSSPFLAQIIFISYQFSLRFLFDLSALWLPVSVSPPAADEGIIDSGSHVRLACFEVRLRPMSCLDDFFWLRVIIIGF